MNDITYDKDEWEILLNKENKFIDGIQLYPKIIDKTFPKLIQKRKEFLIKRGWINEPK
jgi:hypothetical protein